MKIIKIEKLIPTKENHFAVIDKTIPQRSGIYFLFNKNQELLYIGKAKNIRQRILQHTSEKTIREKDGSRYSELGLIGSKVPFGLTEYFSYLLLEDEEERTIRELILINIFKPPYNFGFKDKQIEESSKREDLDNI